MLMGDTKGTDKIIEFADSLDRESGLIPDLGKVPFVKPYSGPKYDWTLIALELFDAVSAQDNVMFIGPGLSTICSTNVFCR